MNKLTELKKALNDALAATANTDGDGDFNKVKFIVAFQF